MGRMYPANAAQSLDAPQLVQVVQVVQVVQLVQVVQVVQVVQESLRTERFVRLLDQAWEYLPES